MTFRIRETIVQEYVNNTIYDIDYNPDYTMGYKDMLQFKFTHVRILWRPFDFFCGHGFRMFSTQEKFRVLRK